MRSRAVAVDVLGSIQQLVFDVVRFVLQIAGLLAFAAVAPVLYLFFGFYCARSGDSILPTMYICTSPIAVSIWVLVFSRALSVRRWHQSGKDLGRWGSQWREAQGGYSVSILKSLLYMFLGGFFSFAAQVSAVVLYGITTGRTVFSPTDSTNLIIFWSLMPLVGFSPVIVVLIHHSIRRRDYSGEMPYSTLPEQLAKAVEETDTQRIVRIAKPGSTEAALSGQALEDHWRDSAAIYRQAAQMMQEEEEHKEADAKMKRELEPELLNRIDAQITRISKQQS